MRGDVADHARQLFFEIRTRMREQLAEGLRDFGVTLDVDCTGADRGFWFRTGEPQERQRRARTASRSAVPS